MGIEKLHDEIYQHLMDRREEDPEFYFTVRKRLDARLKKGYWFLGNDDYIAVSFWGGADSKNKTANISFIMMPPKSKFLNKYKCRAFIQLTARDSIKKSAFLQTIATKIPGFKKDCDGQWHKPYTSMNQIKNLDSFLSKEKRIIDELIGEVDRDGLKLLDAGSLDYLAQVKTIRRELREIPANNNQGRVNELGPLGHITNITTTLSSSEAEVFTEKRNLGEAQKGGNKETTEAVKQSFKKTTSLITAGVLKRKVNKGFVAWNKECDFSWTLKQKQHFIDSMLCEIDTPKIYLYETANEYRKEVVIDGKQRVIALTEYYDNQFPLGDFKEEPSKDEVKNCYYAELGTKYKEILDSYEFTIINFPYLAEGMQNNLRNRLNSHRAKN